MCEADWLPGCHGFALQVQHHSKVDIGNEIFSTVIPIPSYSKKCGRRYWQNLTLRHFVDTVKSRLSKRRLSETTGLFEDYGQSRLFSVLFIAMKLPIIRISIIRKIQFFEVIHRSRLKKLLLNYPSRFEVQITCMVIMISLFSRVRFTHLSDLANKVATGIIDTGLTFTLLRDEPLSE